LGFAVIPAFGMDRQGIVKKLTRLSILECEKEVFPEIGLDVEGMRKNECASEVWSLLKEVGNFIKVKKGEKVTPQRMDIITRVMGVIK